MTTFIWDHEDVLKDYTSGIVVVVADSEQDAVEMLKVALIKDRLDLWGCGDEQDKEEEALALSEWAVITSAPPRVAKTGDVTICRGGY